MRLKIFIYFIINSVFVFANDISGIYLLPKDSNNKQSIVEIFEKNNKFYGFGFATTDGINNNLDTKNPDKKLQNRPIRGSVFINIECNESKCTGEIYSFEKGKTYPIKVSTNNNTLEIKVDVLFGPTFIWEKLDNKEASKYEDRRIDINKIEIME